MLVPYKDIYNLNIILLYTSCLLVGRFVVDVMYYKVVVLLDVLMFILDVCSVVYLIIMNLETNIILFYYYFVRALFYHATGLSGKHYFRFILVFHVYNLHAQTYVADSNFAINKDIQIPIFS